MEGRSVPKFRVLNLLSKNERVEEGDDAVQNDLKTVHCVVKGRTADRVFVARNNVGVEVYDVAARRCLKSWPNPSPRSQFVLVHQHLRSGQVYIVERHTSSKSMDILYSFDANTSNLTQARRIQVNESIEAIYTIGPLHVCVLLQNGAMAILDRALRVCCVSEKDAISLFEPSTLPSTRKTPKRTSKKGSRTKSTLTSNTDHLSPLNQVATIIRFYEDLWGVCLVSTENRGSDDEKTMVQVYSIPKSVFHSSKKETSTSSADHASPTMEKTPALPLFRSVGKGTLVFGGKGAALKATSVAVQQVNPRLIVVSVLHQHHQLFLYRVPLHRGQWKALLTDTLSEDEGVSFSPHTIRKHRQMVVPKPTLSAGRKKVSSARPSRRRRRTTGKAAAEDTDGEEDTSVSPEPVAGNAAALLNVGMSLVGVVLPSVNAQGKDVWVMHIWDRMFGSLVCSISDFPRVFSSGEKVQGCGERGFITLSCGSQVHVALPLPGTPRLPLGKDVNLMSMLGRLKEAAPILQGNSVLEPHLYTSPDLFALLSQSETCSSLEEVENAAPWKEHVRKIDQYGIDDASALLTLLHALSKEKELHQDNHEEKPAESTTTEKTRFRKGRAYVKAQIQASHKKKIQRQQAQLHRVVLPQAIVEAALKKTMEVLQSPKHQKKTLALKDQKKWFQVISKLLATGQIAAMHIKGLVSLLLELEAWNLVVSILKKVSDVEEGDIVLFLSFLLGENQNQKITLRDRNKWLNLSLKLPYNEIFMLEAVRTLPSKSALILLDYLCVLLRRYGSTKKNVPVEEGLNPHKLPTHGQCISWSNMILDAHLAQFVMWPENTCERVLLELKKVIDFQTKSLLDLQDLKGHCNHLWQRKSLPVSQIPLYGIETLSL